MLVLWKENPLYVLSDNYCLYIKHVVCCCYRIHRWGFCDMYRLWIKLGQIIWLAKSIQKLLNIWSITWCRIKMNFTLIMIQFKDVFNYFPIIWFLINEGWIFWFQSNLSHFSQKGRYYLIFEPTFSRKFKPNINLKNICFNVQIIFFDPTGSKMKAIFDLFRFSETEKIN